MKQDLRNEYLLVRKNIKFKNKKDKLIFDKVIRDKDVNKCELILIYVSYNNEVDTINMVKYFLKHKKVGVPRIDNGVMTFYYINNINELKQGYFSILEPTTNNKVTNFNNCVSITPGICFDKNGYRIGYGKGYYDKFYQEYDMFKIGLCYKECLIEKIDNDIYDIAVDKVITN